MGAAEVRVLGPVEVLVDGAVVDLPGRRSRQVLAALAVDVGRSVSVDRLVDLVWAEDPPKSARTQVSIQISALRRVLGEAIDTTPDGYRLRADAVRVDAERAARALHESRRQDCPEDAVGRLRGALNLWRAAPLIGLRTAGLQTVVRSLAELRTMLADALYDAELRLGRHREVIPELFALVDEEPLQESFRAKLMTALWRAGRKAEALEAYQAGRETLVSQLGIEPGPQLRKLHQSILTDDAAVDPVVGDHSAATELDTVDGSGIASYLVAVPAEVPPASPTFTGRDRELAELLHSPARTLALNGPGGVGKSCLARQLAAALTADHPDGQLYVNLRGATPGAEPLPPAHVLCRFLRSLGLPDQDIPSDPDEAAARFRTLSAGRKLLVVLDDAVDGPQVRPLLPAGPDATTIVTSRAVLADLEDVDHHTIGGMDERRSIELLTRMIGRDRVAAEPIAATGVVRQCAGLPLAVKIAGARLIGRPDWTLGAFADRLRDERGRLDELQYGDLAVRASLAVGWQGLGDTADRLLRLIGSLAVDDLGLPAAVALDGREAAAVHRDLDRLVGARLLEPGPGDRYTVHDLVRLDARERSAQLPATDRGQAAERFVHFSVATLRDASKLYAPHSTWRWSAGIPADQLRTRGLNDANRQGFIEWIRAESGNLVRVAQLAAAQSPATITAYALAAHVPVGSQGRWQERRAICELALDTGAEADLAYVRRDLGLVYRHLGLHDRARVVLRQAVEAFRTSGDKYLEADALVLLADGSDRVAGFGHLRRARELARQVDEYRAEANALSAMAELLA